MKATKRRRPDTGPACYQRNVIEARRRRKLGPRQLGDGMGSMLVLCARVGTAGHVPPGYATSDCSICGEPVWVSPANEALARELGLRMLIGCTACIPLHGPHRGSPS